ncbi:DUF975 family protein [Lawsonibacter celer]|jgi:uncharacterized membrane protein|uniref:DUF975 family protein n=1 Tax=Lawsonibacter celer TaxID=2986526 RepID=UPI001644AAF0|nr:DUF975 family protein [Lawsonibacter celer]
MGFNRPEAKMRARASIRGTYPHPALVTLIYFLLTTVLTNVIMAFVSDPFQTAYLYLMDGVYAPERIFQTIFTPGRVGLYLVLQILISLYTCVMQFGYTSYALRLSRWEQPGYRNLMDGFAVVGRVIGINLLIAIFVWLWTMLAMIPYMIVMVIAAVSQSAGLMVLAVLLAIVGTIFGVSVSYRYRLALYFMLDHPDWGVMECIRQSKQTMKGWKWPLFVMDLSFLGWMILELLTFGILSLWVSPYQSASQANFYSWVVYGAFPEPPAPPVNNPGPAF